jgi:hypothetical protein
MQQALAVGREQQDRGQQLLLDRSLHRQQQLAQRRLGVLPGAELGVDNGIEPAEAIVELHGQRHSRRTPESFEPRGSRAVL